MTGARPRWPAGYRVRRAGAGTLSAVALLAGAAATAQADPLLAAAGDIACKSGQTSDATNCHQGDTASLVQAASPTAVAELGDEQYDSGLFSEFTGAGAYDATWGPLNASSHPVPGNHEYDQSPTAAGYFQYFGSVAETSVGYYSYDLGRWHVIALNSNCSNAGCSNIDDAGGAVSAAEVQWLQNDLNSHPGQCTLAYWHHPLFSQGWVGGGTAVKPLWDALYAHGADVVINGHDHVYERSAQLSPSGVLDASRGIREFVSGEGGRSLPGFPSPPTSPIEQSDGSHFGVLFLALHAGSYDWNFEAVGGASLDHGTAYCHEPQASITASPVVPLTAQAVSFDAHASTPDSAGVKGYAWDLGDGTTSTSAAPSHAYAHAGTYPVTVTVTSNNGASTTRRASVTVADRAPSAAFTATPNPALTAQPVSFDASDSRDPDGTITGYAWSFGDGTSSSSAAPSHPYATAGTYTVTLTVTDGSGNTASVSHTVSVNDRPPTTGLHDAPNSPGHRGVGGFRCTRLKRFRRHHHRLRLGHRRRHARHQRHSLTRLCHRRHRHRHAHRHRRQRPHGA